MEIFIKKNSEDKIWLGFHISHGLVILDRSIGGSESDEGYLFFKCSDWSIYKETDVWEKPNYTYVIPYLNSLDKDKIKSAQEDAINKLNHYVDKIKDMHFELLKIIHLALFPQHNKQNICLFQEIFLYDLLEFLTHSCYIFSFTQVPV